MPNITESNSNSCNYGKTVQIVSTGDGDKGGGNDFTLDKDALKSIIDKIPSDSRVSIVSVVGAFRSGKSFLLNFFVRYLKDGDPNDKTDKWMFKSGEKLVAAKDKQEDKEEDDPEDEDKDKKEENSTNNNNNDINNLGLFSWMGGQDRHTTGIWMWDEPFYKKDPDGGSDIAVLLMDTQGMFDNETTMTLTAQIFGVSTMISSFLIYNVDKRVQEDNLQHLALFSEYGRVGLKDDKDNNETSSSSSSSSSSSKPFQRLQFLVRDWQNFDWEFSVEDDEKLKDTRYKMIQKSTNEYLKDIISTRGASDLQATRDQISRCFEKVDCFLLPHPGLEIVRKTYDGSIATIDKFFRGMLDKYVRNIFDVALEPKSMHDRTLTAPELLGYFESYVTMFQENKDGFPEARTILEATTAANNSNASLLAQAKFGKIVEKYGSTYHKSDRLQEILKEAETEAISLFHEVANFGSPETIAIAKTEMLKKIEEEKKRIINVNNLRNPFQNVEYYVVPIAVAVLSRVAAVFVEWACPKGTATCEYMQHNLRMLSLFMIIAILIFAWTYLRKMTEHFSVLMFGGNFVSNPAAGIATAAASMVHKGKVD